MPVQSCSNWLGHFPNYLPGAGPPTLQQVVVSQIQHRTVVVVIS